MKNKNDGLNYLVSSYSLPSKNREENQEPNQDSFLVDKPEGLYLIADGVGGANAGDLASNLAIHITHMQLKGLNSDIKKFNFDDSKIEFFMKQSIQLSNYILFMAANSHSVTSSILGVINQFKSYNHENEIPYKGLLNIAESKTSRLLYAKEISDSIKNMASTLDLVLISNDTAYIAHVGNSRVFHLSSDKAISYCTSEHVDFKGVKPASMDEWSLIESQCYLSSYIGQGKNLKIDFTKVKLAKGDSLYMITDGISHILSEEEILSSIYNFEDSAKNLVEKTNNPFKFVDSYSKRKKLSFSDGLFRLSRKDDATVIGIKKNYLGGLI